MTFAVGDLVRIKAPHELNVKAQSGSAIDKWQNKICVIQAVKPSIYGGRYELSFCDPPKDMYDEYAVGTHISKYFWEEFELEYVKTPDIEEQAYEELLESM